MKKGWELKRLSDVAEYFIGLTYSPKDVSNDGLIVLRSSNIQDGKIDLNDIVRVNKKVKENLLVKNGDILMCSRNGSKRLVGKTATISDLTGKMTFGTFMTIIRSKYNPYLSWFFISDNFREQIGGGENPMINQVTKYMLNEVKIPLPPLPEQKRIVTILNKVFAAIARANENFEKNLANAKELFESYLQGVDAEKCPLGELVGIKTGKLDANAAIANGKYPFFTCSREIFAINDFAFDCEAILLAGNNAVGDFNVKHYTGKFNAYQRTYVITVNSKNKVLYRYLYFQLLKSLKEFKEKSVGAGTKFLKIGMIQNLQIPLPSLDLQKEIVENLDAINDEIKNLEAIYQQKIADLDELKKSILDKAFKGEL